MSKTMSELPFHYGLKMKCYPSFKQKQIIETNINASRFAYNEMVAIDKELYILSKCKLPIKQVQDRIAYLKKRKSTKYIFGLHSWLGSNKVGTDVINTSKKSYQSSWNMFRKIHNHGTPNFHKKKYDGNFQLPNRYSSKVSPNVFNGNIRFVDNKHIKLSLIGAIRVSGSQKRLLQRNQDIRIGTVTVSKDSIGDYYISMQLASDEPFVDIPSKTDKKIGIDLNTDNFLTDSNGETVGNPRYYRRIKGRLAKAQRKLSLRQIRAKKEHRKLRESSNYQKQRLLVSKLQKSVMNQRANFLNSLSTTLIKNHDLVVAEDLSSKNMLKNHALAMSISDVGWGTFIQQLEYKAELYGKNFVKVNPYNTTQTCSDCGYLMKDEEHLTLSDRKWTCPNCDAFHIRDHNAAKNILAKGLLTIA
ncbi:RNA-guided endonuclease InsQ/TnpB family protein [Companilactobacillus baiquanensis]|uniref:RNA-guided endonuclease InsQ/TnpB family protein n=1 Tax=Companilactobacillus baiquanensis TaxID=2486005 RepID=A0ABW1UZP8_9LACO|nr:RNA-guided endonuclease TnpB family protein [Companilactobacillus baiquanensis]